MRFKDILIDHFGFVGHWPIRNGMIKFREDLDLALYGNPYSPPMEERDSTSTELGQTSDKNLSTLLTHPTLWDALIDDCPKSALIRQHEIDMEKQLTRRELKYIS